MMGGSLIRIPFNANITLSDVHAEHQIDYHMVPTNVRRATFHNIHPYDFVTITTYVIYIFPLTNYNVL